MQLAPAAMLALAAQVPAMAKSPGLLPDRVRLDSNMVALPLLLNVSVWLALVLDSVCAPKLRLLAFSDSKACGEAVAVPARLTVAGLALLARFSRAVLVPARIGANCSMTVQLAPIATEPPAAQVPPLAIKKSPASVPLRLRLAMLKVAVPVLLSVTVCAVDLLATTWVKLRLAGETSAFGLRATPLPESAAVELPALWTMLKLPFTVPALAGLKVKFTVQLAPAASELPAAQVPPERLKPLLALRLLTVSAALPLLDSVMACAALLLPTLVVAKARLVGASAATALDRPVKPGLPR